MAMTPIMAALTRRHLNKIEGQAAASLQELSAGTADLRNHVVVIGFGQIGKAVTRHLVGLQLPVLALDYDPKRVRDSQARKLPIYFGNAARPDVLKAAHVGQAKLVIIAIDDLSMAERVTTLIRSLHPKLRVIARAADPSGVDKLRAAGSNAVVVDGLTTALDMAQRAILLYEPEEAENAEAAAQTTVLPAAAATPASAIEAPVPAETDPKSGQEASAGASKMDDLSTAEETAPPSKDQRSAAGISESTLVERSSAEPVSDPAPEEHPMLATEKDPVPG